MNRNYFVYQHVTPDGMYYFGVTKQKLYLRWRPSAYKKTHLQPHIEKFGWKNIKHQVLLRELTYEEAKKTENMLIVTAREDGVCINGRLSGFVSSDKNYIREQNNIRQKKSYLKNRENKLKYQNEYNAKKMKKQSA